MTDPYFPANQTAIALLMQRVEKLEAENEKLRAALKQLHEAATEATEDLLFGEWWKEELDAAAAAALKGNS